MFIAYRRACGGRVDRATFSDRRTAKLKADMTKQQLIEKVAAKAGSGRAEAEAAVDSVLELIAEALRSNERVDLRGFGSFVVKQRKGRQGRNPRTGETITIAAKRDASFKPSKELTEKLAQGERASTPDEGSSEVPLG